MYREYLKRVVLIKHDVNKYTNRVGTEYTDEMCDGEIENMGKLSVNDDIDESLVVNSHINDVNTPLPNENKRKLILHFDIRNTVLVADSVTDVSVEHAINSFLTGVTWGKEGPDGQWQWHSNKLSLNPPAEDVVTFYKYLEKRFVKNTNDRTQLRLATGDFALSEIGGIFYPHFQKHLEMLKWLYPFDPKNHKILTMSGHDGKRYNYIVPAVYNCIHHLVETKRDFAVIFRTFGLDAPNVIKSLSYGLNGNHPGYPKALDLKMNENVGIVKRTAYEPTVFTVSKEDAQAETYIGDRAIYNMLSQKTGISGFRDDVQYWLENSYHHSTAKPHFIDPFDNSVQHIFFDDNFRAFEDDSIIDVRLFESRDANEARSLSKAELAKFENVCLVQADLMKCIEDENYYSDRIRDCENNYSVFLKRYGRMSRSISVQNV